MIKIISVIIAIFCLVFALLPLFYGVFNIGCGTLLVLSVFAFCFPSMVRYVTDKRVLKTILYTIVIVGCASFIIISGLMVNRAYFKKPPETGRYTLIVLGAKVVGDRPSLTLQHRLDKAAGYLLLNPEAVCIVSGGQGDDELYPEGEIMKKYLMEKGVAGERIMTEEKSTNTRENLRLSNKLVPENSEGTVIVTSNFHQLRAYVTANALGMKPLFALSSRTMPALMPAYWVRDLCGVPLAWIEETFINTTQEENNEV